MIVFAKRTVVLTILCLLSLGIVSHARNDAAVRALSVNSTDDFVEFTVTYSEDVRYTYFRLEGPRLVVDFHDADNQLGFEERIIGEGGIERIRTSFFTDATRDATRVVFDLESGTEYTVLDDGEGRVRLRFTGDGPEATRAVTAQADGELSEALPAALSGTEAPEVEVEQGDTSFDSEPRVEAAADALAAAPLIEEPVQLASLQAGGVSTLGEFSSVEPLVVPAAPAEAELADPVAAVPAPSDPAPVLTEVAVAAPPEPLASLVPVLEPAAAPVEPVAALPTRPTPAEFLGQVVEPTETPQYSGEIVSFDFRGLDIRDFFRTIAEISGLNVVLDPGVSGQVNLYLIDVPWDQGLDVVLRTHDLGYELQGNVLRVATQASLQAEEDDRRTLRDAQELNAPLVTRSFILSYSQADTMSPVLTELLSPRGTIITDARRNALIVTDIDSRFERVEGLISFLDMPAQQVEIEARLLSANKSFSRDLGSQIGLIVGNNSSNNLTGLPTNPSPFSRTPAPAVTAGGGSALPLVADFPISSASAGLSFLLGVGGDVLLDSIISVAEARGTAKLLSRPRVTTQNNQVATVEQGTQIPVQTNVNNTVTTQFIQFALKLDVTPQITEAGTILLTAEIENSTPDFSRAVLGIPSVSTQLARTQVLIPDGGTAVIGGILVDSDSVNVNQIPGLGSIPILGNLFKSTQTAKSTSELLFFITARIKPANPLEFLSENPEDQSLLLPLEGFGSAAGDAFEQE